MKRVLLKLSGEALAGDKKTGFDESTCIRVAEQVKKLTDSNRYRRRQFLAGQNQRDDRPCKGRSDRYACDSNELYLCV